MNQKLLVWLVLGSVIFSSLGCNFSFNLGKGTATPTLISPPPTAITTTTPESSATPTPKATTPSVATATHTPLPSPTPLPPEVISAENAGRLVNNRSFGIGGLNRVRVSPDGKTALLAYTSQLALLNLADMTLIWQVDPGIFLSDVAFSQTGQQIIGQAGGGSVWVWDTASGKLIANPIDQQQSLAFMALSPAGNWAAYTGINGITNVYNAATGAPITTNNGQAYPGGISGILMSPDETTLTIQGFNSVLKEQVQQWGVNNGKYKIGLLNIPPQMTAWKYSTDGKRMYGINIQRLTAEPSTELLVWNTTNGDLLKVFPKNDLIYDYLPSPDGKSILIATKDGVLKLLDSGTGSELGSFSEHGAAIDDMAFTPDGQKVVSIGIDGKMILWDTFTRKTLLKTDVIAGAPYSPVMFAAGADLATILSPDLKKVGILDVTSIQPVQKMGDGDLSYSSLAISNLGTYTAAVDELNHIHIWDSVSGQEIRLIEPVTRAPIWKIKFSPDEKTITSLSTGQVLSWEIATGRKLSDLAGLTDFVYSPDSALIASDGLNAFYLSEVQSGKMKMALTADTVTAVQYSPDGRIILAGAQKIAKIDKREEIFIFQVDTGTKKILDLKLTNVPALVTNMAFSPNGDILANSDLHGNIMLWNLRDGKPLILFQEIVCPPANLKFSADGTLLYVGGGDDSISVINTSPVAATAPEPSPTAPSAAATPTKKAPASTEVEAPTLSKTAYTHPKGLITISLPEGWKAEEKEGAINVIDPYSNGGIAFSAVNTVSVLKGDMFTTFVEANEVSFKNSIAEYKETKKELDPENGKAVVIKDVNLDGEDYVWETRYTREQAAVYMFNFLTPANSAAVMAPVNDKVTASAKVSYPYVSKLTPYLVTAGHSDPAGNYSFEAPMGWTSSVDAQTDAQQTLTTTMITSPDNKISIVSIRVEGSQVWDETMVKSVLEAFPTSLAGDTIIQQREKTAAGDPQIEFSSVSAKTKGAGLSSNFGTEVHVFYVVYQTQVEKEYLPLVQYIMNSYKRN